MEAFDINTAFGMAIAYSLAMFARWISKRKFWRRVSRRGRRYLADPAVPIDNPQAAAERALLDEQAVSVRRVARSISIPPPTIGRTATKRGITGPPKDPP